MELIKTPIADLLVIKPKVFYDERGYFYEPYNKQRFIEAGITNEFIQDNQSLSQIGAVRGLHFQAPPSDQGKLVRVVKGAVLDVVVDIRKNSSTYGQHYSVELNEENMLLFWIPPGFAHGFATLRDNTIFEYKCTNVYNKASEGGILWNDITLHIDWGVANPIVSAKDKELPSFEQFNSPF
ncbi:MAG: dTDP-4-dehydrorhamnose 3,5-epimerase [Bacteroidota bacterium]